MLPNRIVKGFPPVSPFIGVSPTLCYLLKEKKPLCCLQLAQVRSIYCFYCLHSNTHTVCIRCVCVCMPNIGNRLIYSIVLFVAMMRCVCVQVCEHCSYRNVKEYQWQNKTIILAADQVSNGIYNFIIPLRAHFKSKTSLNPIILLLEKRPDVEFLDSISYFPLVYWMQGSIDGLDDLLRAGITLAENVVVVNKESSNSAEEDSLSDCNTIVAVQNMFKYVDLTSPFQVVLVDCIDWDRFYPSTIFCFNSYFVFPSLLFLHRFFPSIKSITELSQSSNMRFMQFRAHDKYALHLSKMEKVCLTMHPPPRLSYAEIKSKFN